jgi:uncharacterized protein (TIGR04255 family)
LVKDTTIVLQVAPIVEAVVDIDCDLPPGVDIETLDAAGRAAFVDHYPKAQRRLISEHELLMQPGQPPAVKSREGLQALQYFAEDGKQLVQVRPNGFSFNRLAPYTTLDDYLPEIERTWRVFLTLVRPVVCRTVRMRYINRIELPMINGRVDLDKYLKLAPRLADDQRLALAGFFDQQTVVEPTTGNQATIVFATQPPASSRLPVIFDITAFKLGDVEPGDWAAISGRIAELRDLKNLIFRNSLTPECLNLFRP